MLKKLQSFQNAAARLVTSTQRFDNSTPMLRDLHWLPILNRITYKAPMLVYKYLHALAPSYLADFCRPVSSVSGLQHLRSADTGALVVPRTRTSVGSRSFSVCGPATRNSLSTELRLLKLSASSFARRLKSYLFNL
jgi:hypothetical protein